MSIDDAFSIAPAGVFGTDEDDKLSFCELLQEVEGWLSNSAGDDLCDPRHMYAVGLQLVSTAQMLASFQLMPASPTTH